MVSFNSCLPWLCSKYAQMLAANVYRAGKPKLKQAYDAVFNLAADEQLNDLQVSWIYARSFGELHHVWAQQAACRLGVPLSTVETASAVWEANLNKVLSESGMVSVVVWRLDKKVKQRNVNSVWDLFDREGFMFPVMRFRVAGGDMADKSGHTFYWLLSVMPAVFAVFNEAPLGGLGKLSSLPFSLKDVIEESDKWSQYWLKGTDNWEALEVLFKLNHQVPDMLGMPVLTVRLESMSGKWNEILIP